MLTQIVKWGNSQGIRLPKPLLEDIGMKENDTVELTVESGNIIIKKAEATNRHKSINERFADFSGTYEPVDIAWGEPVGNELW